VEGKVEGVTVAGNPERQMGWGLRWEGTGLDHSRRPSEQAMGTDGLGYLPKTRLRSQAWGWWGWTLS
jgi:hypothetical protein